MRGVDPNEYQTHLIKVAQKFGLQKQNNIKDIDITAYVAKWVDAVISRHGQLETLNAFLELVAEELNVEIIEIRTANDLRILCKRVPPQERPHIMGLDVELKTHVSGVTFERIHRYPHERRFLAAINCRGRHAVRRYFSKWHELSHVLVDGEPLSAIYRRSSTDQQTLERQGEPGEVLVDRIAGWLAFYPPIFEPALKALWEERWGWHPNTWIKEVHRRLAPEASRKAIIIACKLFNKAMNAKWTKMEAFSIYWAMRLNEIESYQAGAFELSKMMDYPEISEPEDREYRAIFEEANIFEEEIYDENPLPLTRKWPPRRFF